MKRLLCLLPAGLLLIGCAEPAAEQPNAATQGAAAEATDFDYIPDGDFKSVLADNNVVVVNFTADW